MPQSTRKRFLKVPFESLNAGKKNSQRNVSLLLKGKGFNSIKSVVPSFCDPIRRKQPPSLPRKLLDSKSGRARIVGGVLPKSKKNVSSSKLPLKSRNVIVSKLPTRAASLLNKNLGGSRIVTEALMQKEHVAPRFMSLLMGKGRLIRHKGITPQLGRKVWGNAEESSRLSHAQSLQLFRALLKEPLPFLELHGRFGISKQIIKRLVKNGLLTEMWGPKAVGVRFKLTSKGKIYLKELEGAAKYEPKMRESVFIPLKH